MQLRIIEELLTMHNLDGELFQWKYLAHRSRIKPQSLLTLLQSNYHSFSLGRGSSSFKYCM